MEERGLAEGVDRSGVLAPQKKAHVRRHKTESGAAPQRGLPRLLNQFIFFALLALIALTAIPYGAADPGWEAAFECSVFAIGILWCIEWMLSGSWQLRSLPLLLPLLALIFLALIQVLPVWKSNINTPAIGGNTWQTLSADPYETLRFALKLFALTLGLELYTRYTSSRRRLRALVYVVIGVGVASAFYGSLRQMMQHDAVGFLLPDLLPDEGYGQFFNRNHFALLMEMALGVVMGLVIARGGRREGVLIYLAAAVPLWVALVLSNSRGGIFSMLCQLLFIGLMLRTLRLRQRTSEQGNVGMRLWRLTNSVLFRTALLISLMVTVVFGIILVGGTPLMSRFGAGQQQGSAIYAETRLNTSRSDIWRATWRLIKANPVAGVGFGGYGAAIAGYHDASGQSVPQQAHNDYLELLASGGPAAMIIGVWFFLILIKKARRQLRSRDHFRSAACFGALAGLFSVAVHSFVDFGLHLTINALIFIVLVVIATAACRAATESEAGDEHQLARARKRSMPSVSSRTCGHQIPDPLAG